MEMSDDINDTKYSDFRHDGWRQIENSITFDGATTNAIGDFNGTGEPHTIFTVTGTVSVRLFALCETTLTIDTNATLEAGTALSTAGLIAQTAGDSIDVNEIWHDASPDSSVEASTVVAEKIVNQDILGTTATANILTGVIKYVCLWKQMSRDGNVVAA